MARIIERAAPTIADYKAGLTEGPLYDKETQLYPVEALPPQPILDPRTQKLVNYNWVMAKTIQALRLKKLSKDEALDVMFKAVKMLEVCREMYGIKPVSPGVK